MEWSPERTRVPSVAVSRAAPQEGRLGAPPCAPAAAAPLRLPQGILGHRWRASAHDRLAMLRFQASSTEVPLLGFQGGLPDLWARPGYWPPAQS